MPLECVFARQYSLPFRTGNQTTLAAQGCCQWLPIFGRDEALANRGTNIVHQPMIDIAQHFARGTCSGVLIDPRADLHSG